MQFTCVRTSSTIRSFKLEVYDPDGKRSNPKDKGETILVMESTETPQGETPLSVHLGKSPAAAPFADLLGMYLKELRESI
jgi:hypothetical protein